MSSTTAPRTIRARNAESTGAHIIEPVPVHLARHSSKPNDEIEDDLKFDEASIEELQRRIQHTTELLQEISQISSKLALDDNTIPATEDSQESTEKSHDAVCITKASSTAAPVLDTLTTTELVATEDIETKSLSCDSANSPLDSMPLVNNPEALHMRNEVSATETETETGSACGEESWKQKLGNNETMLVGQEEEQQENRKQNSSSEKFESLNCSGKITVNAECESVRAEIVGKISSRQDDIVTNSQNGSTQCSYPTSIVDELENVSSAVCENQNMDAIELKQAAAIAAAAAAASKAAAIADEAPDEVGVIETAKAVLVDKVTEDKRNESLNLNEETASTSTSASPKPLTQPEAKESVPVKTASTTEVAAATIIPAEAISTAVKIPNGNVVRAKQEEEEGEEVDQEELSNGFEFPSNCRTQPARPVTLSTTATTTSKCQSPTVSARKTTAANTPTGSKFVGVPALRRIGNQQVKTAPTTPRTTNLPNLPIVSKSTSREATKLVTRLSRAQDQHRYQHQHQQQHQQLQLLNHNKSQFRAKSASVVEISDTPRTPPVSPENNSIYNYIEDDLDSMYSYATNTSGRSTMTTPCDHSYFALNGTTFSGRRMKYVMHCSNYAGQVGADYLTPTQRAQRQIRRLKEMLLTARQELEQKDSEILRLTREVVELRVFKASLGSPEERSASSDAVTVREAELKTSQDVSPIVDTTDDGTKSSPRQIPNHHHHHHHHLHQQQLAEQQSNSISHLSSAEMQSSYADSGHFEDLTSSSVHSKDSHVSHASHDIACGNDDEVIDAASENAAESYDLQRQELIRMYEQRIEELVRSQDNATSELKRSHNDRIEALLSKMAECNSEYSHLMHDYDHAKQHIRELEQQLEDLQRRLAEHEQAQKKMYMHMYQRGEEVKRIATAEQALEMARAPPQSKVSIQELLQQLQNTQDELENIRAKCNEGCNPDCDGNQTLLTAKEAISLWVLGARKTIYRRLLEAQKNRHHVDPEVTLQFLKSAIYYFLTDKENSQGHLQAIESILEFSDEQKAQINQARTTK